MSGSWPFGGVEWHPEWSEIHPVAGRPEGSGIPLYLSIDDAVERIISGSSEMVLAGPLRRAEFGRWIRDQLADGQSVYGYRQMRKEAA